MTDFNHDHAIDAILRAADRHILPTEAALRRYVYSLAVWPSAKDYRPGDSMPSDANVLTSALQTAMSNLLHSGLLNTTDDGDMESRIMLANPVIGIAIARMTREIEANPAVFAHQARTEGTSVPRGYGFTPR